MIQQNLIQSTHRPLSHDRVQVVQPFYCYGNSSPQYAYLHLVPLRYGYFRFVVMCKRMNVSSLGRLSLFDLTMVIFSCKATILDLDSRCVWEEREMSN